MEEIQGNKITAKVAALYLDSGKSMDWSEIGLTKFSLFESEPIDDSETLGAIHSHLKKVNVKLTLKEVDPELMSLLFSDGFINGDQSEFKETMWSPSKNKYSGTSILNNLNEMIPGFSNLRASCPLCSGPRPLPELIIHLNDYHKWSREKIADFLESLPYDLVLGQPVSNKNHYFKSESRLTVLNPSFASAKFSVAGNPFDETVFQTTTTTVLCCSCGWHTDPRIENSYRKQQEFDLHLKENM